MLRFAGLLTVVATLTGCAYHNPTAPTPPAISDSAPAFLTLGVPSPNTVSAYVQNDHGAPLAGVMVQFASDTGSLSPTSAATLENGRATSTLSASTDAHVTATVGTLSARATVAASVAPPTQPTPTPPAGPPSPPTPPPPSVFLNVSSTGTTNVPLAFSVSSPSTGVTWVWTFGDGGTAQTTAFTVSHTYTAPGTYPATVSAAGTATGTATVTVSDPLTPPTPAPTGLVVTIGCTVPTTHGGTTACNLSATYHSTPLFSTAITKVDWDWGDGTSQIVTVGAASGSHVYTNPGSYIVMPTVTAATVDGPQVAVVSKSVAVP